ncbi:MAG: trypsin-like peptidase domain-containing protein [Gammaproteobacteria bacterium]|nr:trypsin-like peptidase domain-containing protein [Gammaproteobacteria bacterium]MCP5198238.1 trypsin-like peptidase domain-containing protein [Gammaproteobacteria bacterium]
MRLLVALHSQCRLLGLLAIGLLLMAGQPPIVCAASLADTVEKVKASIVAVGTIQPTRRPPAKFQATGFVVGRGRHIITNAHVFSDFLDSQKKETLAVFLGQGKKVESRSARKIATDPEHDLALLEIEGQPLPALWLGESQPPREGQAIAFTGFPIGVVLGLFPVTHQGIISAISPVAIPVPAAGNLDAITIRRLKNEPYEVLQLDAIAYPGNSGSPLYEPDTGRVIGIINKVFVQESKESILERPSGITYAIPVRYAQALLKRAMSLQN